ncbi:MAG: YceI family protein [Bacteroidota bacterium]
MLATRSLRVDTSNSWVNFTVKNFGIRTVKGTVAGFDGEIYLDDEHMEASYFDICLTPVTINTHNLKRDEHLKSMDFFYVKNYPTIRFKSSIIQKTTSGYNVVGTLTLLEMGREIVIPIKYTKGLITGAFSLNRKDYGLGKKFPNFIIGKNIKVVINCVVPQN